MTALISLLALLLDGTAPSMPTGTSPEFQATAYKVEQLLGEGKFDAAGVLLKRLPKKTVTLSWDDTGVPAQFKSSFAMARDNAIADWIKAVPDLSVKLAEKGDIKVSFKESLPPSVDSVLPAGAVFFSSDDPADPRTEAVVALKRDVPPQTIDPRHVQNEVGYAIGYYLGMGRLPRPVGYMGRMDSLNKLELHLNPRETALAKEVFSFVDALRTAVEKKTKLAPTRPQMFVNPSSLTAENVHQGDQMRFTVEVTNRGNAPLVLKTFTECGCVAASAPGPIDPGQTGTVQVGVDTALVYGKFEKSFTIYSNDPDQADRVISIKAWVKPAYRFLRANGHTPIVVSEGGLKDEVFLVIDPDRPFKVTKVDVQGLKVVSDFQPWEGTMADTELGQEAVPRKGYKITYLASPTSHLGRMPLTVLATTDSKDMPVLVDTVYVQWGIVAMPEQMYFGEIVQGQGVAYFIVSRPGKPFKILSVKSDSPDVSVNYSPYKNGDYRVDVVISAKAPFGRLDASVTVKTDDPKQPVITVPLTAVIK